jgi:hypothetical protein
MKRILIKLIIAIAIRLIIGVAGSFEIRYYITGNSNTKKEVNKSC